MRYREVTPKYQYIPIKLQEFDSISDLLNYLDTTPYNKFFTASNAGSQSSGNKWNGTETYGEAMELLTKGWSPEAEKLAKKVPIKTAPANVKNSRPTYSTVGFQASVPRYLQGIPTNMVDRKLVVQKQKIIVLNRDLSYHCGWKPEDIEAEGIKALQIIQALESVGYRVKMNMIVMLQSNGETLAASVCVKKPEERMSLIKVAFPLAHTSMFRRIMFKWLEVNPHMTQKGFTANYGYPVGHRWADMCNKGEYLLPTRIGDIAKYVETITK